MTKAFLVAAALIFAATIPAIAAPKGSIYANDNAGVTEIQQVGRGYGVKACNGKITKKDEIKPKVWPKLEGRCGIYTMQNEQKFADDPSVMYSICIGAALEGCQVSIGVVPPCNDLKSCRASLGVP